MRKTLDIVGFINYCYKNGYNTIEIKEDKKGSKNGVIFLGKNIVNFGFSEVDKCPDIYNTSIMHSLKLPMDSFLNLNNFKNRYERNESFISFIHGYKNKIDYYSLYRSCGKYNVRMSCSYCSKEDVEFSVDLNKKEINNIEELVEALKDTHGIDKIIFSRIQNDIEKEGDIRVVSCYNKYGVFDGVEINNGYSKTKVDAFFFKEKDEKIKKQIDNFLYRLGLEKYFISNSYIPSEKERFNFGATDKNNETEYLDGELEEKTVIMRHVLVPKDVWTKIFRE